MLQILTLCATSDLLPEKPQMSAPIRGIPYMLKFNMSGMDRARSEKAEVTSPVTCIMNVLRIRKRARYTEGKLKSRVDKNIIKKI